jgi:hypothetical protein
MVGAHPGPTCSPGRLGVSRFAAEGFVEEYPQLKTFLDALRTVVNLLEVFNACKDKLVELVRANKVTLKVRGKKLAEVQDILQDAKEKMLSILRVTRTLEKRAFIAMTRARYRTTHQDREPEHDGLTCVKRLRKGVLVEVVYIPKTHEEEWELEMQEEEAVEERDVYSRGEVQRCL